MSSRSFSSLVDTNARPVMEVFGTCQVHRLVMIELARGIDVTPLARTV